MIDTWQFWVGIAYFGLAAVTVALWVNYSRVSNDQRKTTIIEAAREADITANATGQYEACVKGIPLSVKINKFVHGVEVVHEVLYRNSLASHRAQDPNSPLYKTQTQNIRRLKAAFAAARGIHFPVRTKAYCIALRNRLQQKR